MKTLREYITESAEWMQSPAEGDDFAIELPDEVLVETYVIEVANDCILLDATPEIISAIGESALLEDTDEGESGIVMETMGYGSLVGEEDDLDEGNIEDLEKNIAAAAVKPIPMEEDDMSEAEYQGRKVALGKPMQGDVKKFKVYVRDPKTGNVKKVNFGDKTMRIKKSNPARRKSFRARHNCANPGPRTKARYWSCRKW